MWNKTHTMKGMVAYGFTIKIWSLNGHFNWGHTQVTLHPISITCNQHAFVAKTYWCLIAWHIHTYVQVKHVTLCTLVQGEMTITQEGQKLANVERLLSIDPCVLLYIVAIYLVLIYGPRYLHMWKSIIYEKEQWSLWLPDHLIMPRQWYECVTLFDIGNGKVLAKLARSKIAYVYSSWAFYSPCSSFQN
jgi:hypothetical protein